MNRKFLVCVVAGLVLLPVVAADLRAVDGIQTESGIAIAPGEEYTFETEDQFQALFETVTLTADTEVDSGAITIRSPKRDFEYPDGVIMMGGVHIDQQNMAGADTVQVTFSIPKRILCQQDLDATDITTWQQDASWTMPDGQVTEDFRYIQFADNAEWNQLTTEPVAEDDDKITYRTTTDIASFSGMVGVGYDRQENRQVPDNCNNIKKTYLSADTPTGNSAETTDTVSQQGGFLDQLWQTVTAFF